MKGMNKDKLAEISLLFAKYFMKNKEINLEILQKYI